MSNPDAPPPQNQPWPPPAPPSGPAQSPPSQPGPPPPGYTYPGYPYGHPGGYHPGGYPQAPYSYAPPPQTPGTAIWALVLGIASIVFLGCGIVAGIPAIILGRSAMNEIDRSGGTKGGRGTAQAGFITGIIGLVLGVLVAILVVVLIVVGATSDGGDNRPDVGPCTPTFPGQPCTPA